MRDLLVCQRSVSVTCTTIVEITGGGWTLMRDAVQLATLRRVNVAGKTRRYMMTLIGSGTKDLPCHGEPVLKKITHLLELKVRVLINVFIILSRMPVPVLHRGTGAQPTSVFDNMTKF